MELGNVRFGSKADMCIAKRHVRFTPNSGINRGERYVCFVPITDIHEPDRDKKKRPPRRLMAVTGVCGFPD